MWKRIIAVTLVAILMGSVITGCGDHSSDSSSLEDDLPITLTLWHNDAEDSDPDSRHQRMLQTAQRYTEKHPGVTVQVMGNVGEEKMFTSMLAGSGPDLVKPNWIYGGVWGTTGVISDLTDFVNGDTEFDKEDILSAAWDRCTYKERIYTIPDEVNSSEFYYNIDLLAKKGYENPPQSYSELVEMAVCLTEYDESGNICQAGFIPDYPWLELVLWPVVFGAKWIDEETNTITFNSPEMRDAFQWQLDIYNAIGYDRLLTFKTSLGNGSESAGNSPFIENKLAMQFCGEWLMNEIAKQRPDMNYGVSSFPIPDERPDLEGAMFITAHVWAINSKSKNTLEDCWDFLSFFTSKEAMQEAAKGYNNEGVLMSRKSALNSLSSSVHPLKKKVAKMLQSDKCDGFPMSLYVNDYLNVIGEQMNLVFTNKETLDDALKEVAEKVQKFADKNPINN